MFKVIFSLKEKHKLRKEKKKNTKRNSKKYKKIEEERRRRSSSSFRDDYGCGLEFHGEHIGCSWF